MFLLPNTEPFYLQRQQFFFSQSPPCCTVMFLQESKSDKQYTGPRDDLLGLHLFQIFCGYRR